MKLVINDCFGGFAIDYDICKRYGFDRYDESRNNKKLIELIESGVNCSGDCAVLKVVEIPDEATDYLIDEYDGAETVLYVLNGKIHQFKDENTTKLRELVHAYKQKESDMNNKVFAVFDIYDENLNGDLRDHLIGICDSLSEAKTKIEKMNLDNFRWLGAGRGRFSENGRAHMIIIDDFVMNEIFV